MAKNTSTWVTLNVKPISGLYRIYVQEKNKVTGQLQPSYKAYVKWPDNTTSVTGWIWPGDYTAEKLIKSSPWSSYATITKTGFNNVQASAGNFMGCTTTKLPDVTLIPQ